MFCAEMPFAKESGRVPCRVQFQNGSFVIAMLLITVHSHDFAHE